TRSASRRSRRSAPRWSASCARPASMATLPPSLCFSRTILGSSTHGPKIFGRLPRLPYGVIAMPEPAAASRTAGSYDGGSLAAGRPGYFNANLSAVNTRAKWEMEALVLHEAVPGHHLQIALAQEQPDLPEFRRHGGWDAFGEGWGLYAETLGYDMGFYKDPYAHFGALNYQMWRAIRLVVDTGIHAFGW